jgi:Ala-tRNA(Pro) deacylase
MSLVQVLPTEVYLRRRGIHHEIAPHGEAETTATEARRLGIPASEVLKVVVLRTGDGFEMAIIPASTRLDMHLVCEAVGGPVRLASEAEIAGAFPDFELGAIPPIPGLLGIRAWVDPAVLEHDNVAFADGKRTESMIASPRELLWGEEAIVTPIADPAGHATAWRFEGDGMIVPEGAW